MMRSLFEMRYFLGSAQLKFSIGELKHGVLHAKWAWPTYRQDRRPLHGCHLENVDVVSYWFRRINKRRTGPPVGVCVYKILPTSAGRTPIGKTTHQHASKTPMITKITGSYRNTLPPIHRNRLHRRLCPPHRTRVPLIPRASPNRRLLHKNKPHPSIALHRTTESTVTQHTPPTSYQIMTLWI